MAKRVRYIGESSEAFTNGRTYEVKTDGGHYLGINTDHGRYLHIQRHNPEFEPCAVGLSVKLLLLTEHARIPTYATDGAACFDLYAAEDVIIAPGETVKVPLGFSIEIPDGYEMQIRMRSGIAAKTKLRLANGVGTVDSDYRGEVAVIFDNIEPDHSLLNRLYRAVVKGWSKWVTDCVLTVDGGQYEVEGETFRPGTYKIYRGDRVAQAIVSSVTRTVFEVSDGELTKTERGEGGFGSTGTSYEDDYGIMQCRTCGTRIEGGYCECYLRREDR